MTLEEQKKIFRFAEFVNNFGKRIGYRYVQHRIMADYMEEPGACGIIRDEDGWHFVHTFEREPDGFTPDTYSVDCGEDLDGLIETVERVITAEYKGWLEKESV